MTLDKATRNVLTQNMGLKSDESCLIVFDKNKTDIANSFFNQAKKITSEVKLLEIPVFEFNGQEPSEDVFEEMMKYYVVLLITTKSLSHTKARKNACAVGSRVASMPGITEEIILRTLLNVDYIEINKLTQKYNDIFSETCGVRVTTKLGTDITFDLNKSTFKPEGLFLEFGQWGNLPAGESCFAPVEGSANGKFIVDSSMSGIGKLKDTITFVVKDGFVVDISGGDEARSLKKMLVDFNDPSVYNIAELGIGTNPGAKINGVILEDEKVLGTAHIALGNNLSYPGGSVNAPCHLDGVFLEPTIFIKDKVIIKDGKFIGEKND